MPTVNKYVLVAIRGGVTHVRFFHKKPTLEQFRKLVNKDAKKNLYSKYKCRKNVQLKRAFFTAEILKNIDNRVYSVFGRHALDYNSGTTETFEHAYHLERIKTIRVKLT